MCVGVFGSSTYRTVHSVGRCFFVVVVVVVFVVVAVVVVRSHYYSLLYFVCFVCFYV